MSVCLSCTRRKYWRNLVALGSIISRFIGEQRAAVIYNLKRIFINRARFLVKRGSLGFSPALTSNACKFLAKKGYHTFFGYYDLSPLDAEDTKCLATLVAGGNTVPSTDSIAKVGYYDLSGKTDRFIELGQTSLWCWQQSCRLQWYPTQDQATDNILYNTLTDKGGQSVIQNFRTRAVVREFRRPIYATTHDGRYGFSLDFARLHRLRPGYGYAALEEFSPNKLCPNDNGIWRIDLHSGEEVLLFTIADVAAIQPLTGMSGADHYFNHILVNPSGTRLLFFHLQTQGKKKSGRLLTANLDGSQINVVVNSGHASHYCWDGNDQIICYSTIPERGTHIYRYQDQSGEAEVLLSQYVDRDCHMSLSPVSRTLLIDSYPDQHRLQALALCDLTQPNREDIAFFYMPASYSGELRCDLHPRFNADGSKISVDCVYRGHRAICILSLEPQASVKKQEAITT